MTTALEQRRVRLYWFNTRDLLMFLNRYQDVGYLTIPKFDGVPADAQCHDIHYEHQRRCWGVVLAHPSFEVVTPYERIPDGVGLETQWESISLASLAPAAAQQEIKQLNEAYKELMEQTDRFRLRAEEAEYRLQESEETIARLRAGEDV